MKKTSDSEQISASFSKDSQAVGPKTAKTKSKTKSRKKDQRKNGSISVLSRVKRWGRRTAETLTKAISQKFTIMLIPHSEKRVVNFQINTVFLGFLVMLFLGILGGFFYLSTVYPGSEQILSEKQDTLEHLQGNLDNVIDEVHELMKVYQVLEQTLADTLNELNIEYGEQDIQLAGIGDLASVIDLQEVNEGEIREIYEVRRLRESLNEAIDPLKDIAEVLDRERELLSDIPTMWPVIGGRSLVTMEFGPNIHPIRDQWYLHKGIDIAGARGLPIVTAANGKVIESRFDTVSGYGNMVLIEHKYGFRTRYSHMSRRLVEEGDEVYQGQQIGALGNTGLSSGSHLDFQIMLGTEVLDPASFLKIRNNFSRWLGNRGAQ